MKIRLGFIIFILFFLMEISYSQSPYKISWGIDGSVLFPGSLGAIISYPMVQSIKPIKPEELSNLSGSSVNSFDRSAIYQYSETASKAGDAAYAAAAVAPFFIFLDNKMRDDWLTVFLMYAEAMEWSVVTSAFAKLTAQRIRPLSYNPDAPIGIRSSSESRMSFFSSHTSVAFASAAFLSSVYSEYNPSSQSTPFIWGGSFLTAGIFGYLRYAAGEHYPTDILAGAVAGSLIGLAIPWLHKVNDDEIKVSLSASKSDFSISMKLKY